jgi:hypothetical protein
VFFFRASKYYPDASQVQFEGLLLPAWRFVMSGVLFQGVKVLPRRIPIAVRRTSFARLAHLPYLFMIKVRKKTAMHGWNTGNKIV